MISWQWVGHWKLPIECLPENDPQDDEIHILAHATKIVPAPSQTISFTDLPAEIRNRIYEYTLPSSEEQLVVATPFRDDLMSIGVEPAITKLSKQVRSESLVMFYTNSTFVAYIEEFDFSALVPWVKAVTSCKTPPKVTVQVKLLDRIRCVYSLLDLVRAWRDINHQTIHLRIHNCYANQGRVVFRDPNFDQRALVAKAIEVAENLHTRGTVTEKDLLGECYKEFEQIDRRSLGSGATLCDSCAFVSPGYYHSGYQAGHDRHVIDEMFQ